MFSAAHNGRRDYRHNQVKELLATERVWLFVSIIGLVAATAFLLLGYIDAAFVTATLGVVAWFVNLRARLKKAAAEDEEAQRETDED